MTDSNKKKSNQLGQNYSTAYHKLRKKIMFHLVKEMGEDECYRCGEKIETLEDFSIEHKENWLDGEDPVGLFFDLNNIAFSHLKCNVAHAKSGSKLKGHGMTMYVNHGCRCSVCRSANAERVNKWRKRKAGNA